MNTDQVVALLQREAAKAGGQAEWARQNGLSPGYVSDVVCRRREPGRGVLDALGLERVDLFRRVPRSEEPAVKRAAG